MEEAGKAIASSTKPQKHAREDSNLRPTDRQFVTVGKPAWVHFRPNVFYHNDDWIYSDPTGGTRTWQREAVGADWLVDTSITATLYPFWKDAFYPGAPAYVHTSSLPAGTTIQPDGSVDIDLSMGDNPGRYIPYTKSDANTQYTIKRLELMLDFNTHVAAHTEVLSKVVFLKEC